MGRRAEEGEGDGDVEKGFFACYLLTSLNPRFKGHTYIGFTVNPRRRIRQHNGEIGCGAFRTKTKRPWEMVLCIHGFPTNVSALKFEWAWQHPTESLAVRQAAAGFKSLSGLANKIKLAYTMFALPPWQSLNITVNYFSTKYKQHSAGCPSLPEQMKVTICPMDELPCYSEGDETTLENEDDWGGSQECDEDNRVDKPLRESVTDAVTMGRDGHCKTNTENLGCIENYGNRQIRDSSTSVKDYDKPLDSFNSPVRVSSSIHNGTSNITVTAEDKGKRQLRDSPARARVSSSTVASSSNVTATARDRHAFGLRRESSVDLVWSGREELSSCNVFREVEIIDVFTPSSCIRPTAEDRYTFAWIDDNGKRQLRDLPTNNSPSRRPSSIATGASNITETTECEDTFARIEDNGKGQSRNSPARARTSSSTVTSSSNVTATTGDRNGLGLHRESSVEDKDVHSTRSCTVSQEVEIIDVFTPSPDCRVGLRSKKRRVASTCPEIIDLTKSPIFVQL